MRVILDSPRLSAIIGSSALMLAYFGILTVANSFSHAVEQLTSMWYLVLPLILGFGVQMWLYSYIRTTCRVEGVASTSSVAAVGGVSTTSMIACCAHHATDVLPIIGLSGAAVFLTQYQAAFMGIGLLSNFGGAAVMLNVIQTHRKSEDRSVLDKILRYDMKRLKNSAVIFSVIFEAVLGLYLAGVISSGQSEGESGSIFELPTQDGVADGIEFSVTPIMSSLDQPVAFEIVVDTHQGSLDFDLKKISTLEDSSGRTYTPLDWKGSPAGGHHISGILEFPAVGDAESITLTIKLENLPEQKFRWDLTSIRGQSSSSVTGSNTDLNLLIIGGVAAVVVATIATTVIRRPRSRSASYEQKMQEELNRKYHESLNLKS